jgi:hypothetical protein
MTTHNEFPAIIIQEDILTSDNVPHCSCITKRIVPAQVQYRLKACATEHGLRGYPEESRLISLCNLQLQRDKLSVINLVSHSELNTRVI